MNRQNARYAFLGLIGFVVLVVLGLWVLVLMLRYRPPQIAIDSASVTATPTAIPSPTSVPLPDETRTPRAGPPAGPLSESQMALDFDLSAIRPETIKEKLFEPVIGRPPSTTAVRCPQDVSTRQFTEPTICYNTADAAFFLAGFQPNETVRILRYVDGLFDGTADLRLDDMGRGLLTAGTPTTDIFVIRENGAYIASDPALGSPYVP